MKVGFNKKRPSIQLKLLLSFIIVITVCTIIFTVTAYLSFSRTIASENKNSIYQVLDLARSNMSANIERVENLLVQIQSDSDIESVLTRAEPISRIEERDLINRRINRVDVLRSTVSEIYFYVADRPDYPTDPDSNVFSTDYVKNEIWYRDTMAKNGETYLTVIDSSPSAGVLCIARPFIDTRTHKILGLMRIDVNLAAFMQDISKITLGKTGKVFLVYENHIINPWSNSYINSFVNEKKFFDFINSGETEPTYINIASEEQIVAAAPLYSGALKLVCAAKYNEINNSIALVRRSTMLTAVITLLAAILIMFIISQWITKPIKRLISHMEGFSSKGSERLPADMETKDEIGRLCTAYNRLLSTIDSLIEDVKTLYKKQKIFELKALQAQINPHFLYNTLDSINWMAKRKNAKDISSMVTSLGRFFRHSLNKGSEFTTIENEIKQVISYTDIQKVRFTNKFEIFYDIDEELLGCRIIKLIVQPLVENSIVHGFEELEGGGKIKVEAKSDGEYIYITVNDNGCGCDTNKLNADIQKELNFNEPIEKYGLNNVNQRIKLYFDDSCGLHFETNAEGGVCAVIKVLRRKYDNTVDM
ncbi:MAG: sensor histidine kinase [Clostridiales bacterium]|nr:sensor histidine kinase [Clostridiales bacterium]